MRFACLLGLLLTACGATEAPCLHRVQDPAHGAFYQVVPSRGDETVVQYPNGREVRIRGTPRRIVSMLPGLTEAVAWLGGLDRLVAVTPYCNRPAGVEHLPRVAALPVEAEGLARHRPDLILADGVLHAASLLELERWAPAVLVLQSRTLADLDQTMSLLARVLGTPKAAERARRFHGDLHEARLTVGSHAGQDTAMAEPVRVLLIAQSDPLIVLGPGALLDDMLRTCGVVNAACDLGRASGPFAEELVLERRPDWILTLDTPLTAEQRRRWGEVPALRTGRVVSGRADDLVRAGPRTPAALARLGGVLHGRLPGSALGAED